MPDGDHAPVPERVEDEAGGDGVDAEAWAWAVVVATGGGAHGAAGEVGPAEQLAFGGDEYVWVVVAVEVRSQEVGVEGWEGGGAGGLGRFWVGRVRVVR
jgi:hypothetical protein